MNRFSVPELEFGPRLTPAERVPAAGQILFGVRLKPGVAFLLTGVAVHKLTDRRTPLLALLAEDALRLEDRLARLQTVDEGLDILEAFLLQRMETSPSVGSAGMTAELGYCDRAHLVNEVAQFAGMSPGRIAPHGVADFSKTWCE